MKDKLAHSILLLPIFIASLDAAATTLEPSDQDSDSDSLVTSKPTANVATVDNPFAYLDWYPRALLPEDKQAALPSFCSGDYLPYEFKAQDDSRLHASAGDVDYQQGQKAKLTGGIELAHENRLMEGDRAEMDSDSGLINVQGNVRFHQQDFLLTGETATYNTDSGKAVILDAEYSFGGSHLRGTAEKIRFNGTTKLAFEEASFTYCEPGHNDWDIVAGDIFMDQATGFGEASHTRFRIAGIPVMYFPYYRFPIDDRRLTGFLDPNIQVSTVKNDNGVLGDQDVVIEELATPLYINIAPNYDDTLTPQFLRGHGWVWNNEFRYLTKSSSGTLTTSYLDEEEGSNFDSDERAARQALGIFDSNTGPGQERWFGNYNQTGRIGRNWTHAIDYSQVSDLYYFDDLDKSGDIDRRSFLNQSASIRYAQNNWRLNTQVFAQQRIAPSVPDAYRKLPEVELSYGNPYQVQGLKYGFSSSWTQFDKDPDSPLSGVDAIYGQRFRTDGFLSYPMEWPWAFIKPEINLYHRSYRLTELEQSLLDQGWSDSIDLNVPTFNLDAGLFFDREFKIGQRQYSQSLEPRIFYLRAPNEEQDFIPSFDSTLSTFGYGQMFSKNRFGGGDRIGDANQLSYGISSSVFDEDGFEQVRASIGQILFFEDRDVQRDPGAAQTEADQASTSAVVGEVQFRLDDRLSWRNTVQWNPHLEGEKFEDVKSVIQYHAPLDGLIANVVFSHNEAEVIRQVNTGVFWSINDRWAVMGQLRRNILSEEALITELAKSQITAEELNGNLDYRTIESIAGIEYQDCCWRVAFTYEERTRTDASKDHKVFFQLTFKGLGQVGKNLDRLFTNRILGYDKRQIHDY